MRLTSLTLDSLRSYPHLELSLDSSADIQVFIGDNGSGKTNIIEAISLLSHGRSCLKVAPEDVLRFEESFFKVRGTVESGERSLSLEYVFQISPRRGAAFFVNDAKTPLLKFLGTLPTVIFLPEDLGLFTGSPSARRSFLDLFLTQSTQTYAAERMEYEKILKQRNALLKSIGERRASESDLDVWDTQLSSIATGIVRSRTEVSEEFSRRLPGHSESLGEQWKNISLEYRSSGNGDLESALLAARAKDLILQTTTVGPHRDDWILKVDGRPIGVSASRGQQRAALIALLLSSAELLKESRGEPPVILLDDVLSEFDPHHQSALLHHLKGFQVFITTAHDTVDFKEAAVWKVGGGRVKK